MPSGYKELAKYVRWVADQIELRDWTFELPEYPCAAHAGGHADIFYGRKHAEITFNSSFDSYTQELKRHVVVHELVHCHHASTEGMVRRDLEDMLGKHTDQIFWLAYKRQHEYEVDALARAIEKHVPCPDGSMP